MKAILSQNLNNWFIAYSSYVDTLHVYNELLNKRSKDKLTNKTLKKADVIIDSSTREILLFELKHASQKFEDIDSMDKKSIIKAVERYIHGKS